MKAAILGSQGQLGTALLDTCPAGVDCVGFGRLALDVTSVEVSTSAFGDAAPDLIINVAAFTDVDGAESKPEVAHAVNAVGAGNIARLAHEIGARLLHVSTDFVFDGHRRVPYGPDDETSPLGVYGRSKRDGEVAVLDTIPGNGLVLRTAWLYGAAGSNFVKTMLRLMRNGTDLRVVNDQTGSPTYAGSLASTIWRFADSPELRGIYHWTDAGTATWFEFAIAVQEEALALGLLGKSVSIEAVPTDGYPTPAQRPKYSVLDCSSTCDALGIEQVPWRENLRQMLKGLAE